jgi:hypothetical protein
VSSSHERCILAPSADLLAVPCSSLVLGLTETCRCPAIGRAVISFGTGSRVGWWLFEVRGIWIALKETCRGFEI